MHRRRGGKIFSLSRHIQVRTSATAIKQAVSARPSGWDIPSSRPTAPPSPLTTSTPAGLGKWAPPISKWAKPESLKPSIKAENQNKLFPRRQNPQTFLPPDRGFRPKPSASFAPPRGTPAPGKWTRPPGFISPKPAHSTPAKPSSKGTGAQNRYITSLVHTATGERARNPSKPTLGGEWEV
ncbi:hypothetical protein BDM02DRAFT_3116011 [Thelephora ganbajun]|uniref:Uncharacterized protein n=1 Tax=Thelephora ganbajun TaxID=370292 RepID=A0ACB6ZFA8_THEGA|nr:hypothetical protein BDM02DRAFT_3116011 [Thelephora ganbajun]